MEALGPVGLLCALGWGWGVQPPNEGHLGQAPGKQTEARQVSKRQPDPC